MEQYQRSSDLDRIIREGNRHSREACGAVEQMQLQMEEREAAWLKAKERYGAGSKQDYAAHEHYAVAKAYYNNTLLKYFGDQMGRHGRVLAKKVPIPEAIHRFENAKKDLATPSK